MKPKINRKYISIGIVAFSVIACSIIFFFLFFQVNTFKSIISKLVSVLGPILYGLVIAYLLTPLTNFLERKIFFPFELRNKNSISLKKRKFYRIASIVLTIAFLAVLLTVLVKTVVPQLIISIRTLGIQFPYYLEALSTWLQNILKNNKVLVDQISLLLDVGESDLLKLFNNTISPHFQSSLKNISSGVLLAVTSVWNFIIGLIISIYVLINKELFAAQAKKIVYSILPLHKANQFIKDTRFVSDTFIGFLSGKLADSFIIFLLSFISLTIIDIPYALLISVIVGVTNIIPFFGPFIGAIPSAILVLMVDPIKCLYFIIFILILQQLDGNVIGPLILGDSTGLSGFWVIFSITVFGSLWGFLGMIIGIPFFAVVYAMIKRHVERRLHRKHLPKDTEFYKPLKSINEEDGSVIELYEANVLNFKPEKKSRETIFKNLKDKFSLRKEHKLLDDSDDDSDDDEIENKF